MASGPLVDISRAFQDKFCSLYLGCTPLSSIFAGIIFFLQSIFVTLYILLSWIYKFQLLVLFFFPSSLISTCHRNLLLFSLFSLIISGWCPTVPTPLISNSVKNDYWDRHMSPSPSPIYFFSNGFFHIWVFLTVNFSSSIKKLFWISLIIGFFHFLIPWSKIGKS